MRTGKIGNAACLTMAVLFLTACDPNIDNDRQRRDLPTSPMRELLTDSEFSARENEDSAPAETQETDEAVRNFDFAPFTANPSAAQREGQTIVNEQRTDEYAVALRLFEISAEAGINDGYVWAGIIYQTSDQYSDVDAAVWNYFQSLETSGNLQALQALGDIFWTGSGSYDIDRSSAARFYARALNLEGLPDGPREYLRGQLTATSASELGAAIRQEAANVAPGLSGERAIEQHAGDARPNTPDLLINLTEAAIADAGSYQPGGVEIIEP